MSWDLKSDRPIYTQLLEHIQLKIISGEFSPGDKLPSVRELAAQAAVNPNTMQKALAELEKSGLVYSQRTAGRFITEDKKMLEELKNNIAKREITDFINSMKNLGFTVNDILQLMQPIANNENQGGR